LEDAALKGFDAIVGLLLDHGALINQVSAASGNTALYSAAAFGKQDTVKVLLKRGANPNLRAKSHKTAYTVALENGFNEVAAEIEKQGGLKTCDR
jgi:ankyrin repeat protein